MKQKQIQVEVTKQFPYKGKTRKVGSKPKLPAKFGNLMITIGKAVPYTPPAKPEPKPKAAAKPKAPAKAKSTANKAPAKPKTPPEPEPKAKAPEKSEEKTEPAPQRNNTYQNRAMKSE